MSNNASNVLPKTYCGIHLTSSVNSFHVHVHYDDADGDYLIASAVSLCGERQGELGLCRIDCSVLMRHQTPVCLPSCSESRRTVLQAHSLRLR